MAEPNISSTFFFSFLHSIINCLIKDRLRSSVRFNSVAILFRRFTAVSSHRAASMPNVNRSTSLSSSRYFLSAAMLSVLISFLIA